MLMKKKQKTKCWKIFFQTYLLVHLCLWTNLYHVVEDLYLYLYHVVEDLYLYLLVCLCQNHHDEMEERMRLVCFQYLCNLKNFSSIFVEVFWFLLKFFCFVLNFFFCWNFFFLTYHEEVHLYLLVRLFLYHDRDLQICHDLDLQICHDLCLHVNLVERICLLVSLYRHLHYLFYVLFVYINVCWK